MPNLAHSLIHAPQEIDTATLGRGPWVVWIEPLDYHHADAERTNFREAIAIEWPPEREKRKRGDEHGEPQRYQTGEFYQIDDVKLLARLLGERQKPSDPRSRSMFLHMTLAEYEAQVEAGTAARLLDPRPDEEATAIVDKGARGQSAAQAQQIADLRAQNAALEGKLNTILSQLGLDVNGGDAVPAKGAPKPLPPAPAPKAG